MDGRTQVGIPDVRVVAPSVLRHRMHLNFQAEADRVVPDDLIDRLLDETSEAATDTEAAGLVRMGG